MKLLFMCVANSARSQLAEGLARKLFPEAEIQSAGSNPGKINPYAVKTLGELGINISSHRSKSVSDLPPSFLKDLDYVITLCAEEVCPMIISEARKLHWPFPDPATTESLTDEEMLNRFRTARDSIFEKIKQFKISLHDS